MSRKYELSDQMVEIGGRRLYRIRCVRSFGDVKAGEWGGFVEGEHNLSHENEAWVFGNGKVFEKAHLVGNAMVKGDAEVYGEAYVAQNARIAGAARVCDKAIVMGNARVLHNAQVRGSAIVKDDAVIKDQAQVRDHAKVQEHAMVGDNSDVFERATLYGAASVLEHGQVFGDAQAAGNAQVRGRAQVFGRARLMGIEVIGQDRKVSSPPCGEARWPGTTGSGGGRVRPSGVLRSELPQVDWIEQKTCLQSLWQRYDLLKKGAWPIAGGQFNLPRSISAMAAGSQREREGEALSCYPTLRAGAWPILPRDGRK